MATLRPRTWGEYHSALAGPPALLGIAPLETEGDPDTVEFVSGKSDVKMAEYGGFGHPAVYSAAARTPTRTSPADGWRPTTP